MSKSASQAAAILGKLGGKIGGLSKSPKKIAACRENAKRGGRPAMPAVDRIAKAIVKGGKGRVSEADAMKFATEIVKSQGGAK